MTNPVFVDVRTGSLGRRIEKDVLGIDTGIRS